MRNSVLNQHKHGAAKKDAFNFDIQQLTLDSAFKVQKFKAFVNLGCTLYQRRNVKLTMCLF